MQLFAFGMNHHTAPLAVREQVTFHAENLEAALRDLVAHESVREAAIISTCNRTDIYCSTPEPVRAIDWLARFHHLKAPALEPFLYTLPRERAVTHAFRVASGLDSMVIGEPQILGQMKNAVKSAEHAGTLGTVLHKLFQSTFSVAKEVRTQTDIGSSSVSMAAAAVKVAEREIRQRADAVGQCAHPQQHSPDVGMICDRTAKLASLERIGNRALGRALGPAVVRNRVRRRLRAMLQQASCDARLPPGMYLFGAQPSAATRSSVELQFDLNLILSRIRA